MSRRMMRSLREQEKKPPMSTDAVRLWTCIGLLIFVVLGVAGILLYQWFNRPDTSKQQREGLSYFSNEAAEPEMSEEGIKGVIRAAYYTNDGSLAVKLKLSNGLNTRHTLTSLEVRLTNEQEELIASGYTRTFETPFVLEPMGTGIFTFYIAPEHVKITDDDLDQLTYTIDTTGQVEDASVLPTTTVANE